MATPHAQAVAQASGFGTGASGAAAIEAVAPARLSRTLLLWIYAIVPVGIVVPLLDATFFGHAIRRALPAVPDDLLYWTLIFNVPHIVASELILLDRDYLRHYRRPLLLGVASVAIVTWLVMFGGLDPVWGLWFGAFVQMFHVIGQQVGILRMMGGGDPGRALPFWRVLAVFVLLLALARSSPLVKGADWMLWLGALLYVPMSVCAVLIWRRVHGVRARLYLLANHAMFLAFVPLAHDGYTFFLIVMPRVVHDLTAFAFYVNHDTNRNREKPHGALYRVLGFTRLPPWVLLPGVSIAAGYGLTRLDPLLLVHPIGVIALFHYFMEAVSWRSTGLHRQSVALA